MRSPNLSNVYNLDRFRHATQINVSLPGALDYCRYRVEELQPGPRYLHLWAQLKGAAVEAIPRGKDGVVTRRAREEWLAHRLELLGIGKLTAFQRDPLPDLEARIAELEAAQPESEAQ